MSPRLFLGSPILAGLVSIAAASATALAQSSPASLDEAAYRAEIQKWRDDREASLRSKEGWLSIAGLFFLKEGRNTFGSDRSNDFVLPASAPPHAGWFELSDGRVHAHISSGLSATFRGEPVAAGAAIEMKKASDLGQGDALAIGPLTQAFLPFFVVRER